MSRTLDLTVASHLELAIDRLVANELDDSDRRALLLHLDHHPAGWRHCALAFLENQSWRAALDVRPSTLVSPVAEEPALRRSDVRSSPRRGAAYAVAASVALLVATVALRAKHQPIERQPEQRSAQVVPVDLPPDAPALPAGQPVGWVSLINPAEGEALPRQVPILAATAANEQWLKAQPATIPDYVRAQWERRGYLVEENHRLVGLNLHDGRQVAIPVDEVALSFVGRQPL